VEVTAKERIQAARRFLSDLVVWIEHFNLLNSLCLSIQCNCVFVSELENSQINSKSSPKSFWKSHVAAPHGRKWSGSLHVCNVDCRQVQSLSYIQTTTQTNTRRRRIVD